MYPRPLPLPEPPQTRRGVEANGERSQSPVCPLTLERVTAELQGDTAGFLTARARRGCAVPPGAVISPMVRGTVVSGRGVVLLLTVQARFSSGTKKGQPLTPEKSETSSLPLKKVRVNC